MSVDLGLSDRVVAVTGGSAGIGLATVRLLHGEGALLATCARDGERLVKAVADAGLDGGRVLARSCDVRDEQSVQAFVSAIEERFGRLDGLVNNAGRSMMKRLADTSAAEWWAELELKLGGILHPTSAALPLLRRSDAAAVVNVNAVLAVRPEPALAATSAARAAALNLSKTLAAELAGDGIRVNSVCLGLIGTDQWRRRYERADTELDYGSWQHQLARDRGITLGRFGTPDEVAAVIAFLLSPRSSYLTGTAIDVAGGIGGHIH